MKSLVIYPGSFDPVTYGHLDVIERALRFTERLIVAVAYNLEKEPMFTVAERVDMLKKATRHLRGVTVESFKGLSVDYAKSKGAKVMIRGLRMISDFEYEFQMALTNRRFASSVETIFMMPNEDHSYISSKLIKEAASLGANLGSFVPDFVEKAIKAKLSLAARRKR